MLPKTGTLSTLSRVKSVPVLRCLDTLWDCGRVASVQSGIWAMKVTEPLVGVVRSCTAVSESFVTFNRLAAALAKSQDRRASLGVFAFWHGPSGRVSKRGRNLPHPEKTTGICNRVGTTNRCVPALIEGLEQ